MLFIIGDITFVSLPNHQTAYEFTLAPILPLVAAAGITINAGHA